MCRQHGAGAAAAAVRGRAEGSGAGQGRVPAVPRRLDVPEAAGPRAAELQPLHPPAGGGVAAAEPDGADLHRGGRRGHGGDVVRGRAAVPPVLPGDGVGRNHGRGARRGAAGGDAARAGARAEGDVQRGRARRAAVELSAPAERNLRGTRRDGAGVL